MAMGNGEARARVRARGLALASALVLALSGAAAQVAWSTVGAWRAVFADGPARFDDAVAALAGTAAVAIALWLALALVVSALAALTTAAINRGRGYVAVQDAAQAIAPAVVRHFVGTLLGVVILGTAAGGSAHAASRAGAAAAPVLVTATAPALATAAAPVLATPAAPVLVTAAAPALVTAATPPGDARNDTAGLSPSWTPGTRAATVTGDPLSPGWVPSDPGRVRSRPGSVEPPGVSAQRLRAGVQPDDEVVVRRGDSLWTLAARHLGPGATVAEIAAEWPRWFEVNRHQIGGNPDRLIPGERLRAPASVTATDDADDRASGQAGAGHDDLVPSAGRVGSR